MRCGAAPVQAKPRSSPRLSTHSPPATSVQRRSCATSKGNIYPLPNCTGQSPRGARLLKEVVSVLDLGGRVAAVDLDLHHVALLVAELDELGLRVCEHTDLHARPCYADSILPMHIRCCFDVCVRRGHAEGRRRCGQLCVCAREALASERCRRALCAAVRRSAARAWVQLSSAHHRGVLGDRCELLVNLLLAVLVLLGIPARTPHAGLSSSGARRGMESQHMCMRARTRALWPRLRHSLPMCSARLRRHIAGLAAAKLRVHQAASTRGVARTARTPCAWSSTSSCSTCAARTH
jgi:hypothetical protein